MLTDSQKRLYARQILLAEVGFSGQEQLCAARVQLRHDTDEGVSSVARDYLARAGVSVVMNAVDAADGVEPVHVAMRVTASDVEMLASDAPLAPAARYLAGSLLAVEAMKQVLGQGRAGALPDPQMFTVSRAKEKQ